MWAQIFVVAVLIVLLLICLACLLKHITTPELLDELEPTETDAAYDALIADYRRRARHYNLPPSALGSRDGQEL